MEIIKYIILGIVQGFTEPLPISSSGHLLIFKNLFNLNLGDLNFEIITNFGSLLAILFLYRKKIIKIIKEFFLYIKTKEKKYYSNFKYALLIVVGTIPAGILGLLFKDKIELISSNVKYVGIALLITALALFIVKNINGKKDDSDITYKDAIKVGLFQAIALLPGISRSGATLTGALLCNIKKDKALDFSFMLYIPISLATMVLGVSDLVSSPDVKSLMLPYFLGFLFSIIVTYFALKLFIDIVKKNKLIYFVIYCLIVGTLVILFL
ncbi:MAG: undecaprenyl-diphosphate phosphatase [bacterium]|nr:undecaprenyl-diphosphate phosphatase [bacterium]